MIALLKLIPLKDWLYIGAILVLITGFTGYTLHERHIGAQKIVASDVKAVAAAVQHNDAVNTAAQDTINEAVNTYAAAVHVTASPAPSLVCHSAPSASSVPSGAAPAGSGASGAPSARVLPTGSDQSFDPAGRLVVLAAQADQLSAELALAQATIRAYQTQGVVTK